MKFEDVYGRWRLSRAEAAEIMDMSGLTLYRWARSRMSMRLIASRCGELVRCAKRGHRRLCFTETERERYFIPSEEACLERDWWRD